MPGLRVGARRGLAACVIGAGQPTSACLTPACPAAATGPAGVTSVADMAWWGDMSDVVADRWVTPGHAMATMSPSGWPGRVRHCGQGPATGELL
jgi:hypothetical protein